MSGLVDRATAAAERWKTPISVLSIGWFVLTCAAHARFIELPQLELLTGTAATVLMGLWNGLWWGFLKPRIERRRSATATLEVQNG